MSTPWPPAGTVPLAIDVVSVQSQVVYGRVGNNVALPTLRAFGLTTAAVPTVILSNTPHYASLHGGATSIDWFSGWLDDLVQRGAVKRLKAVLCGYLGSVAQADALADWLDARAALQAGVGIVIDPVIGDHDHGVYVDPGLVDVYRRKLLPLAIGATPNDFELAQLTGREISDAASAVAAARTLLTGRLQWIAVTSTPHAQHGAETMQVTLVMRRDAWAITHPRIDAGPKGTGDLFSAALTCHWLTGQEPPQAAASACAHVLQALRLTEEAHCAELLLPNEVPLESAKEISIKALV